MPSYAAVATSEIQAAEAGAAILRRGGNAVDAAIATAAALTVTEPTSNGLGGDLFALVWDGFDIYALDASGAAPRALDPDAVRAAAPDGRMPTEGWATVTVPTMLRGWEALHGEFGSRPWASLLEPAAALASDGFRVGPRTAAAWARAVPRLGGSDDWRRAFMPGGSTPTAGARFSNPDLGATLLRLAARGADDFYRGSLSRALLAHSAATGGFLSSLDLVDAAARQVRPLSTRYRSWDVIGMTAPTQGVVALQALAVLAGMPDADPAVATHRAVEAIKLAFGDAAPALADPVRMLRPVEALLAAPHVAAQRARIDDDHALPSPPPAGIDGGTVLVCTMDRRGMACSLIQSNYMGFGSGIVVPGTGIVLHNRGAGFVLDPAHPNALAPGRRPFHTILPGLLRTPRGVGAFGCMGGQMQPQGHVQLVTRMEAGQHPQQAIDAPRWRWLDDGQLLVEQGFDPALADALAARGHDVRPDQPAWQFGGAQVLLPGIGGRVGGSDSRKDGGVVVA